jgi:hypothetical protein
MRLRAAVVFVSFFGGSLGCVGTRLPPPFYSLAPGPNFGVHLNQLVIPEPAEWAQWVHWIRKLPLFLDLGDLRIVHACWDAEQIEFLNGDNRLTDDLLFKSAVKGTPEYWAIKVLLKGKDVKLPKGHTFTMPDGNVRDQIRVKWWLGGEGHTFHSLCVPECDTVPKLPVDTAALKIGYAPTEPPTFIGHY